MKPGYANWSLSEPPLKLVVFEGSEDRHGSINHLGVEVDSPEAVIHAGKRLRASGLETSGVDDTICCFAEKVETWVDDGRGQRWEWYVKRADHESQKTNVVVNHRGQA